MKTTRLAKQKRLSSQAASKWELEPAHAPASLTAGSLQQTLDNAPRNIIKLIVAQCFDFMKKQTASRRCLTHAEVGYVLESTLSDAKIAKDLNVTQTVITNIRDGNTYGTLFPDLPRRFQVRCANCRHWLHSECFFGFPEPKKEGHLFAALCAYFIPKDKKH